MGGGNAPDYAADMDAMGLSPRGRGKRYYIDTSSAPSRSIPAWAGETLLILLIMRRLGVYPRVGGGNGNAMTRIKRWFGLSPRGRGKQFRVLDDGDRGGSIPAWAGETRAHVPIPP